jgi:tetratricopeptide (TPR) repeat protein
MIGNIFKKLLGKSTAENSGTKLADKFKDKSEKFAKFLGEKSQFLQQEFQSIKSKCNNLKETNYQLGMKHLEDGNLTDAIFRFRFIKKFWPELLEGQYQLAYCLILDKKPWEAKKVLQELLAKNPDYDKAKELLDEINDAAKTVAQTPDA